MKKIKLMGLTLVVGALLTGCSCSKVDENTYVNAVSAYNSSDAISFTRIEKVEEKNNQSSYSTTTINGTFIFDTNRSGNVLDVKYTIDYSKGTTPITSYEYYYNSDAAMLFRKKKIV